MKALVAGFHMLYRLSPDLKFQTVFTLPQKKDAQLLPGSVQSTLNNSATRTSLAMILDAYESPSPRLSHAVSFVSRFEVSDHVHTAVGKQASSYFRQRNWVQAREAQIRFPAG